MQAVVIANGSIENAERARVAAENADLLIAADGGTGPSIRLGLMPDIVVGDLDSLEADDREVVEASGTEVIPHPTDKDQTDLELALLLAVERAADEIIVLGAMGGRLDMTLANLLLLAHPALAQARVELWHGNQTAWVVRSPGGSLVGKPGDTVSLIPLGGDAEGITTHDLKYSLSQGRLQSGLARGVSNVISGPEPSVELRSGFLLAVHLPEFLGPGGSRL